MRRECITSYLRDIISAVGDIQYCRGKPKALSSIDNTKHHPQHRRVLYPTIDLMLSTAVLNTLYCTDGALYSTEEISKNNSIVLHRGFPGRFATGIVHGTVLFNICENTDRIHQIFFKTGKKIYFTLQPI